MKSFICEIRIPFLGNRFILLVLLGGGYGKRVGKFDPQKVLLLLPCLRLKMSEIGANQMKKILMKISMISITKRKYR